jgi:hypothetical protein
VKDLIFKIGEIFIYIALIIISNGILIFDEPILLFPIYFYIYNSKKLVYIFLIALLLLCNYMVFIKFVIITSLFNFILQLLKFKYYNNFKTINIYNLTLFMHLIFIKICEQLDFLYVDLIDIILILIIINIVYSCIMSIEKKLKRSFLLALDGIFR